MSRLQTPVQNSEARAETSMSEEAVQATTAASDEFEREPVAKDALKGANKFWGMYAGEHAAGTEFMIGPLFLLNGVSIKTLLSCKPGMIPERTIYWEFGKQAGDPNSGIVGEVFQAARRGKWKAVCYGLKSPVELYDLEADPGESKELSQGHPKVHGEFISLFKRHSE